MAGAGRLPATLVALVLFQVRADVAFVTIPGASVHKVPELRSGRKELRTSGLSNAGTVLASAGAAVAAALLRRSRRDESAITAGYQAVKNRVERRWWSIEEDRDPTTLPVWQRDYRFGFQVLRRSMIEARKKGEKIFWDVRVIKVKDAGCTVEMLNSGLIGWMEQGAEGTSYKARAKEGDILKVECLRCPMQRVNGEQKFSPWPNLYKRPQKAQPEFSHYNWLQHQENIKKARRLKAGMIVDVAVHAHCPKGLVMAFAGPHGPKGMLDMHDISRKKSSHKWVDKMFPTGTKLKCYVVHSDTKNGRITLSTKEFEDDDHVGWMLSFPERCFAMADEAAARYHAKRDAYIAWLQR
eukprot:CAMPEP_0181429416 /NCGR_PEP_ID=MMETSP1110-20121109/17187_1 /TAXON_ID=174948 /ORGANISM="Symbiodinium sp., Strain CCMP421" /LENGTH=352 /DNA_ID=CAMNT_0023552681 /DNA_START=62 /DNA_END=1120 /DNA_ORIENTATION=+